MLLMNAIKQNAIARQTLLQFYIYKLYKGYKRAIVVTILKSQVRNKVRIGRTGIKAI